MPTNWWGGPEGPTTRGAGHRHPPWSGTCARRHDTWLRSRRRNGRARAVSSVVCTTRH